MTYEEILADENIHAVVIAAPAEMHFQLTRAALLAGKHVLVEKPLALDVKEAAQLTNLAKVHERILFVGHLLQYHAAFQTLLEIVKNGDVGQLQYVYSNRLNLGKFRREENILWSFAPHDVSMILALVGELPKSVYATGANYLHSEVADVTTTHMEFPGGQRAHVFVSWLHPFKDQKMVVVGDQGMIVFDDTLDWPEKLVQYHQPIQWEEGLPQADRKDGQPVPVTAVEPLGEEARHFLSCVASGEPAKTDGDEGTRVLKVLDAAERSMRTGKTVSITDTEDNRQIHETAIVDEPSSIGEGTKIWHFSHILADTSIGRDCVLGQNVMIGPSVTIGDRCKIQNNVSIYKGVTLEEGVFCGPSCVFTNVNTPRAEIDRAEEFLPTLVCRGTTIGANATIVCGSTLGEYSFIAAGAVVTDDVQPHAMVMGVPARRVGWASHVGERLGDDLVCPRSGRRYKETDTGLQEVSTEANNDLGAPIAFIDLAAQQRRIRKRLDDRIHAVLDHGKYIMGPEVKELEQRLADFTGAKHCISCSSGTDALVMSLMALGVGQGDGVLMPSFTFIATAEAAAILGAVPIFVDVLSDSFMMDPESLTLGIDCARARGIEPKVVIPVDLFGQPADYQEIRKIAAQHNLSVIADAAQSFGAAQNNSRVGTLAPITATSFFPAKPLGCYGDGGAIFTDDDNIASALRSIRSHGAGTDKYDNIRIGVNGRMDTLQAAILLEKLELLEEEIERRQAVADRYQSRLEGLVETPALNRGSTSAWAQYTILVDDRNNFAAALSEFGVPTAVYYPTPLHRQTAYKDAPTATETLNVSENLSDRVLSLPMHPYLDETTQDKVCDAIAAHLSSAT